MRVIAGSRRHLILKTVPGMAVRPTQDRTKETLFNILQPQICDAVFLDLFSGSGAIGIEAVSRGAKEAVFIEKDRNAAACIRDNIKATHFEAETELLQMDILQGIAKLDGREPFDIVFMDPPYREGFEEPVLKALMATTVVGDETCIIVEALLDTDFSFVTELGLEVVREKKYKTNKHVFLEKQK